MADPLTLYGAAIGTAAALGAIWNIYQGWRLDRPNIKLTAWCDSDLLRLKVANRGRRPWTLEAAGARCASGEELVQEVIPTELGEGQAHTVSFTMVSSDQVDRLGRELRALFAISSTGDREEIRLESKVIEVLKGKSLEWGPRIWVG